MTDYVEHRWINPRSMERRTYQEKIAKRALDGNMLVVLPTGMGKTPLAALVAAYRLEQDMHKKIMFMAPSKPLVNQHKKSLDRFLKVGPDEIKVITGKIKPTERGELYKKADIVVSTPQTIRNDLKKGVLNMKDYSLLIVDEAHRAVKNYAYTYVAKKYIQQSEKPLILALTASPGGHRYKIEQVKKALFIKNVEVRTKDDTDVTPYIKSVQTEWVELELTKPMQSIKKYLEQIKDEKLNMLMKWNIIRSSRVTKSQLLTLQQSLARSKSGSSFAAMSLIAEIIKVDHAIMLLETQCLHSMKKYMDKVVREGIDGGTKAAARLIANKNFKDAARLFEHSKDARLIIFTQYRCKPVALIGQAGSRGLNQKEQVRLINDYDLGFYNCLVCTSIGEEGLHLGSATAAIFYEPVPSAIRTVQRRGRVGREQMGRVYILITKNTRDEAYYWAAKHKESKMTKILYRMKEKTLKDFSKA
ncbi:MAG: hypothetical protein B6U68_03960 [Candidatus Aenigmarchaeota archaeon ex4484_14]|nr:MAG: hypothetical protein B6U68_03960 [Candidatus Aenigmarchaeota archaeon ex4484_14]